GACDFAGGGAAHAVGDHEERSHLARTVRAHFGLERRVHGVEDRDDERIFVVLARAPHVGPAEDVDDDLAGIGGAVGGHEGEVMWRAENWTVEANAAVGECARSSSTILWW